MFKVNYENTRSVTFSKVTGWRVKLTDKAKTNSVTKMEPFAAFVYRLLSVNFCHKEFHFRCCNFSSPTSEVGVQQHKECHGSNVKLLFFK